MSMFGEIKEPSHLPWEPTLELRFLSKVEGDPIDGGQVLQQKFIQKEYCQEGGAVRCFLNQEWRDIPTVLEP